MQLSRWRPVLSSGAPANTVYARLWRYLSSYCKTDTPREAGSSIMPNNIPSAVSLLPQQNKSTPNSDSLCQRAAFLTECSSEIGSRPPPEALKNFRAPLRALNRLDQPDGSKRAEKNPLSNIPAVDSALWGVEVHRLADGVSRTRFLVFGWWETCCMCLIACGHGRVPPSKADHRLTLNLHITAKFTRLGMLEVRNFKCRSISFPVREMLRCRCL
jgi:hypothetical protein